MVGGFALWFWVGALPQYKNQLLPFLYVAAACGIIFIYLLLKLSDGRGIIAGLGLILLAFVGHIAVQSSFLYGGAVVVVTFIDHAIPPVPVWPLFIAIPVSLACAARLKQAAEDDDPWLPAARSWFGRREMVDLDCPCEDGKVIAQLKEMCARQNAELTQVRKALEARHSQSGQLEEIEAILTLPGVREKLRNLVHPDKHPNATPAEQRRLKDGFQKLSALYKRLGR